MLRSAPTGREKRDLTHTYSCFLEGGRGRAPFGLDGGASFPASSQKLRVGGWEKAGLGCRAAEKEGKKGGKMGAPLTPLGSPPPPPPLLM